MLSGVQYCDGIAMVWLWLSGDKKVIAVVRRMAPLLQVARSLAIYRWVHGSVGRRIAVAGKKLSPLARFQTNPLSPAAALFPPTDIPILKLSNFSRGIYRYTRDLLALEAASSELAEVPYNDSLSSPLHLEAWERALCPLPDKGFTHFLHGCFTRANGVCAKNCALMSMR